MQCRAGAAKDRGRATLVHTFASEHSMDSHLQRFTIVIGENELLEISGLSFSFKSVAKEATA